MGDFVWVRFFSQTSRDRIFFLTHNDTIFFPALYATKVCFQTETLGNLFKYI